jgi:5'-3' exonuclease
MYQAEKTREEFHLTLKQTQEIAVLLGAGHFPCIPGIGFQRALTGVQTYKTVSCFLTTKHKDVLQSNTLDLFDKALRVVSPPVEPVEQGESVEPVEPVETVELQLSKLEAEDCRLQHWKLASQLTTHREGQPSHSYRTGTRYTTTIDQSSDFFKKVSKR